MADRATAVSVGYLQVATRLMWELKGHVLPGNGEVAEWRLLMS